MVVPWYYYTSTWYYLEQLPLALALPLPLPVAVVAQSKNNYFYSVVVVPLALALQPKSSIRRVDTPGVRGFYFTASTGAHPQSSLALLPLALIRIQMFQLVSGPQRLMAPPRRTGGQLGPRARTHAARHLADPGARFWAAFGPAHPCRCH